VAVSLAIAPNGNGVMRMYVDGRLDQDATFTIAEGMVIEAPSFAIGAWNNGGAGNVQRYFDGFMRDVRVVNGVLSSAEIAALATARPRTVSGEVVTGHEVLTIAANNVALAMGIDNLADPISFARSVGLLTADDELRYRLDTGSAMDLSAPMTRQEYARVIERMVEILRRHNIHLTVDAAQRRDLLNPMRPQQALGTHSIATTLSVFLDQRDVRVISRSGMTAAFDLGLLSPLTFEETQVFFVPSARDALTMSDADVAARNASARESIMEEALQREWFEAASRVRQGIDMGETVGFFAAPNDFVTSADIEALYEIFPILSR
jgi:hypothetical protein